MTELQFLNPSAGPLARWEKLNLTQAPAIYIGNFGVMNLLQILEYDALAEALPTWTGNWYVFNIFWVR